MIPIIEIDGIEEAQELIQKLHALGSSITSAEVNGRVRVDNLPEEKGKTNADVLIRLGADVPGGRRNFYTMIGNEEDEIVVKPFVKKLFESITGTSIKTGKTLKGASRSLTRRDLKIGSAIARGGLSGGMQAMMNWANQKLGNAMKVACKSYLKWVTENIEEGRWRGKGGDLSEWYKEYKKKKHGFIYPIGVATGQLLDNVAPASKNIKINRSK